MIKLLVIGVGGFIGAIGRYSLQVFLTRVFPQLFPLGTFAVNILGCFLIGVIYALSEESQISDTTRIFFSIGFCGSFTTFSTFSAESLNLIEQGNYFIFLLYLALSVILGILAVFLGIYLARILY